MPKSTIQVVLSEKLKTDVMELVNSGKNMTETAKIVGVSVGRVSQIVTEKRLEWTARREIAIQDHIEVQLAKLTETYRQADEAFLRSTQDGVTVTTMKNRRKEEENGKELNRRVKKADAELRVTSELTTRKGQCGDPSFLKVKADLIATSLKLLGAFPKDDKGPAVVINQWPWQEMAVPVVNGEALDMTPSAEVEARIEAEVKSETPPSNNGNRNGHA